MDQNDNLFSFTYYGRDANEHKIGLYDASISYYGLARTLSIIGHYYVTGSIISHAPKSKMPIYILPVEDGSFRQNVMAGAIAGILAAPFGAFATKIIETWIPLSPDPQMQEIIMLLKEQNALLQTKQPQKPKEVGAEHKVNQFVNEHYNEIQVVRSVTSNSFKSAFFPLGRSADYVTLTSGKNKKPFGIVDVSARNLIDADVLDDEDRIIVGVVNSFNRSSKTGIMYSDDLGRGFKFEYVAEGTLDRQDDFSWSQYTGKKVRVYGKFVVFFDGKLKKILVYSVERLRDGDD